MIKCCKSPLAQSIILASGVAQATFAIADTTIVSRCNDQDGIQYIGPSLRSAIAGASDFDTIDMTNIVCSSITLERGEIPVYATGLKIAGPTSHTLTIDAHGASRVFNASSHAKYSPFALYNLTLTNGSSSADAGGCISGWYVKLESTTLTGCHAKRYGGAVAARYALVQNSIITGNSAGESGGGLAGYSISVSGSNIAQNLAGIYGGGVYASSGAAVTNQTLIVGNYASRGGGVYADALTVEQSTIWLNKAVGSGGGAIGKVYAKLKGATLLQNSAGYSGGGVWTSLLEAEDSTITGNVGIARGGGTYSNDLSLTNSVVDGNSLTGPSSLGGGIVVASSAYYAQVLISNSTISGNHAHGAGAIAFDLRSTDVHIANSTIAFNTADNGAVGGVRARACAVILQSSIIAKNSPGSDFYIVPDCGYQGLPEHPVTGSNNIVVAGNTLPSGTSAEDPQLSPLAYHGGTVRTHALLGTSPAIDAGNNLLALATDARGAGFDRVVGAGADIGAYERQIDDDELFCNGFD